MYFCSVVGLALLALPFLAQTTSRFSDHQEESLAVAQVEFSGRLVDGSGQGLAGVKLCASKGRVRVEDWDQSLDEVQFPKQWGERSRSFGIPLHSAVTDDSGRFVFQGMAPGKYEILGLEPAVILTSDFVAAPSHGVQLVYQPSTVAVQVLDGSGMPRNVSDFADSWLYWLRREQSLSEAEIWAPITSEYLLHWASDGIAPPDLDWKAATMTMHAPGRYNLAMVGPGYGVAHVTYDVTGQSVPEVCVVRQGKAQVPGLLAFDVLLPPGQPKSEELRLAVYAEPSGVYLGAGRWPVGSPPQIQLPPGKYRFEVSAPLWKMGGGGGLVIVGPDGFRNCRRPARNYSAGERWVTPGCASVSVSIEADSFQRVEVALPREGAIEVAIELRPKADPQPKVHLFVRPIASAAWKGLLYQRFLRDQGELNWIRAGMTRISDEQLAEGIWDIEARCEDGSHSAGRFRIQAGKVTTVSLKLQD